MTGALLVTNQTLPTLHLETADDFTVPFIITVPLEEVLSSCRPASRNPLDPSCLVHSTLTFYFAFCVLFRQMFTFAPLADILNLDGSKWFAPAGYQPHLREYHGLHV